jgi:hypothetical protein
MWALQTCGHGVCHTDVLPPQLHKATLKNRAHYGMHYRAVQTCCHGACYADVLPVELHKAT